MDLRANMRFPSLSNIPYSIRDYHLALVRSIPNYLHPGLGDQDAVKKGVEDVGEDLLSALPGLTPG